MKPRGWKGEKGCACCGVGNDRPRSTDEQSAIERELYDSEWAIIEPGAAGLRGTPGPTAHDAIMAYLLPTPEDRADHEHRVQELLLRNSRLSR